jgi:diguanylate cyclase (GGDEF)-like protein
LAKLILPVLALGLALLARDLISRLSGEQLTLARYLPYLLSGVVIIMAYQFNRCRFLLLAAFSAGSFWVVRTHLQVSLTEPEAARIYATLALAWPLSMLLLLAVPERGIFNRWGFVYTVSIGVLALAAPRLLDLFANFVVTDPDWLKIWPTEYLVLPLLMSAMFLVTLLVGILLLLWRNDVAEVAILTTLGAGFITLGGLHLPNVSLALLTVAGLLQVTTILSSSHDMAYRDDLTGLLGRRALNEKLNGLGPRYCLAMLDVDHFKKFNDTYGHDVGDQVLKLAASRISRVRAGGTAFRYGGEEFCIVFPRKSAQQCVDALEEVREAVADYRMALRDKGKRPQQAREGQRKRGTMATRIESGTVAVTVSVGLAERNEEQLTPEAVIKAADGQLYRAKQGGRNRLCY